MSIIEDLQTKLSGSQESIEKISKELQSFINLKNSLVSTDGTLKSASENISQLALAAHRNLDSISETTNALRETISVIKKTDPAQIIKGQEETNRILRDLESKVTDTAISTIRSVEECKSLVSRIEPDIKSDLATISQQIQRSEQQIQDSVKQALSTNEKNLQGMLTPLIRKQSLLMFLVIANILISVFLIVRHIN